MSIPFNAKLQVTRDNRIYYRGADNAGIVVDPAEAHAYITQQHERGILGQIEFERLLEAIRAQSGQGVAATPSTVETSKKPVKQRSEDIVARADEAIDNARKILGDALDTHSTLAQARSRVAERAPAPAIAEEAAPKARSITAKRSVLHVIDVPENRCIDDLKGQPAAVKWLSSMASKLAHHSTHTSSRPVLTAALVGPDGVGRKLAAEIYANMLFENGVTSAARVHVIDLRRIIESGSDLHAVIRQVNNGVVLIENADILDRHTHHDELTIIEALAVCEGEPVLLLSGAKELRGTLDADYRTRDTLRTQVVFGALDADILTDIFVREAKEQGGYTVDADGRKAALGRLRSLHNAGGDAVTALLEEVENRLAERLYPNGKKPETPHSEEARSTITGADVRPATFYDKDGKLPSLERLKKRVGQEQFKAWAESFANRVIENQLSQAMGEPVSEANNNMLILGEKGTGKTSALEFVNDLLYETGERNGKLTYVTASELIGSTEAESTANVVELYKRGRLGLIAIDEAHILAKSDAGKAVIRALVPLALNESANTTLALLGYPGPMADLLDPEIDEGTDRRFPKSNRVTLDVPSRDNLRKMLVDGIKSRKYEASDDVIDAAMNVLDTWKTGAGFGNAGAIRDLINDAITALANRQRTPETMRVFIAEDFGPQPENIATICARFDSLVGVDHIKAAMERVGETLEDQRAKKRPIREAFQPYARILGPTGSGRKEIAKLLTSVYKSFALIGDEKPAILDVTSLKGDVLGAAVTLTNAAVRRVAAAGGHLVLHNLGGIADNPDQYARDVVSTLKTALTAQRDNLAVSLVGTDEEVAKFLALDPELAALFNRRFDLNEMDGAAAAKVLTNKLTAEDYALHAEAATLLPSIMEHFATAPNWKNGLDIETLKSRIRDEHLSVRRQPEYAGWERNVISAEAVINAVNEVIGNKGGEPWSAEAASELARPIPLTTKRILKKPADSKEKKKA